MRKIYAYTQADVAVDLFESSVKFDDDTSALALCTHDEYVVLASANEELMGAFETKFKTEPISDLELMNLQINKEIKEIRGKEYTLMPFT